ncbi:AraC family transcriptional regulator [Pontiella agarivorans]|uniref:AraC family transcriptional regulator n=1 Tax=Pontiella agarivorans TaxID=3038953 RepID=A0ABU5MWS6_9BACT|nr:AraC family transcriptional regulator [Pontiella agarivorans]MDZ8118406.1 AraC family transcriptional regulator [Pontiella agarivorans]
MSLVKSGAIFDAMSFPVHVDRVENRALRINELHRHEYFELLYVKKGSLSCCFKSRTEVLKRGEILIIKPYVLHMLEDRDVANSCSYFCSFLPQVVDLNIQSLERLRGSKSPNAYFFKSLMSLLDRDSAAVKMKLDAELQHAMQDVLELLKVHAHTSSEKSHALCRFHFLELMALMSEQHERASESRHTVKQKVNVSVSKCMQGLRTVLNYIHDHYNDDLTLESMARMCGTAEPYFCRLFKNETGTTFMNYLNGLRIRKACELLRDTSDTALEICYQVGFSNYPRFLRQFKKNIGRSPVEFRREQSRGRRNRRMPVPAKWN